MLSFVSDLCGALDADTATGQLHWSDLQFELVQLVDSAVKPAVAFERRAAQLPDLQVTLEHALGRQNLASKAEASDLQRLQVYSQTSLPLEWGKPRKYRRLAVPDAKREREDAEAAARKRWGSRILEIIREAGLPYVRASGPTGGNAMEQRCCRGLRSGTLAKKVRDWKPFRRFLLALGLDAFPTDTGPILE